MARVRLPALDRMAIGLSGLCVVHCVLGVLLVATLSISGTILGDPQFHEYGLAGAVALGAVALGQGYLAHRRVWPALVGVTGLSLMTLGLFVPHGWTEAAVTIAGVVVLAVAHLVNAR